MKQVLLDTDIILDLYLDRKPFADAAATLWGAHEAGYLIAYVLERPDRSHRPVRSASIFTLG